MPKIMYLGATEMPAPQTNRAGIGELRINKDLDELTEGELSLLLAKQKLEIDQHNAVRIGGVWKNEGYNRSIGLVNHMLANVHNPQMIIDIGERFEQHPDAHIAGLGKFIKKVGKSIATGVKAVGKGVVTAAKATGKGVATAAKATATVAAKAATTVAKTAVKAVTFVPKLIAKGIMEIYLPKAAPMFLYLFTSNTNLPDKMRRKKEKAEKFKRFVCGKLDMKEEHLMGIIRNALTKKYGTSPESYLATQLKAAGISGVGYRKRRVNYRIGDVLPAPQFIPASVANRVNSLQPAQKKSSGFSNVLAAASQGNVIGVAISAISWIISKLSGSKEDALTAEDYPDPQGDAGNSVNFNSGSSSSSEDYSNTSSRNQVDLKNAMADLIDTQASDEQIRATLDSFGYLSQSQKDDLFNEVKAGYTPLSDGETIDLANEIKKGANADPYTNGGGSGSYCKC